MSVTPPTTLETLSDKLHIEVIRSQWLQTHPLVATVLWILGADTKTLSPTSEKINSQGKLNALTWRDQYSGGNIYEYVNLVQVQNNSNLNNNNDINNTINNLNHNNAHGLKMMNENSFQNNRNSTDNVESPQWDFFVPITPPQQTELFE
eukprot:gene7240-9871_t